MSAVPLKHLWTSQYCITVGLSQYIVHIGNNFYHLEAKWFVFVFVSLLVMRYDKIMFRCIYNS